MQEMEFKQAKEEKFVPNGQRNKKKHEEVLKTFHRQSALGASFVCAIKESKREKKEIYHLNLQYVK